MNPEINNRESTDYKEETENKVTFHFKDLDLNQENPRSEEVQFVVEKQPITIQEGNIYPEGTGVIIDSNGSQIPTLLEKARDLQELPEEERIHKVLELVRKNLKFPYSESITKVSETNPSLAEWVEENIYPNSKPVKLSELLEKGYGICKHLSALYLYLAQEAGLEGVYLSINRDTITNILRSDNGEPLFKMTAVGGKMPVAHGWVEIKTSSGKWIPVDPTTNLVGDTEDGLSMFKQANYIAEVTGFKADITPSASIDSRLNGFFEPAQSNTLASVYIQGNSSSNTKTKKTTYSPYKGDVELTVSHDPNYPLTNFRVKTLENNQD